MITPLDRPMVWCDLDLSSVRGLASDPDWVQVCWHVHSQSSFKVSSASERSQTYAHKKSRVPMEPSVGLRRMGYMHRPCADCPSIIHTDHIILRAHDVIGCEHTSIRSPLVAMFNEDGCNYGRCRTARSL